MILTGGLMVLMFDSRFDDFDRWFLFLKAV